MQCFSWWFGSYLDFIILASPLVLSGFGDNVFVLLYYLVFSHFKWSLKSQCLFYFSFLLCRFAVLFSHLCDCLLCPDCLHLCIISIITLTLSVVSPVCCVRQVCQYAISLLSIYSSVFPYYLIWWSGFFLASCFNLV